MKDMLQSKVLISFIVFVLGFTYLNTVITNPENIVLENDTKIESEILFK